MTFTDTITDSRLCELIKKSDSRLFLAAPGISNNVADALIDFVNTGSDRRVFMMVDNAITACQQGYGDSDALAKVFSNEFIHVVKFSGLRIGLISDGNIGWIFAPLSLVTDMFATDATTNAVRMSDEQVKFFLILFGVANGDKFNTADKENLNTNDIKGDDNWEQEEEKCIDEHTVLDEFKDMLSCQQISELTKEDIDKVKEHLKSNPQDDVNIRNTAEKYTKILRYVELGLIGCDIQTKVIKIPDELLKLVANTRDSDRLNMTYKILDKTSISYISLKTIRLAIENLRKKYICSLNEYGSVILNSELPAFNDDLKMLESELEIAKTNIKEILRAEVKKSLDRISSIILPHFKRKLKLHKTDGVSSGNEFYKAYILNCLPIDDKYCDDMLDKMKIKCTFKELSVETVMNHNFVEALNNNEKIKQCLDELENQH